MYIPRVLKFREHQERARGLTKDQVKLERYTLDLERKILRDRIFKDQERLNDVSNEIEALNTVLVEKNDQG